MRWKRMKTPWTEAIHLSTKQDMAGTDSPPLTWHVLHSAWGHSHDRWEGGSVHTHEVFDQGASVGTSKIVVWLFEHLFVKNWNHPFHRGSGLPANGLWVSYYKNRRKPANWGWLTLLPNRTMSATKPWAIFSPRTLIYINCISQYLFTDHYSLCIAKSI